jgi:hypothetical protein
LHELQRRLHLHIALMALRQRFAYAPLHSLSWSMTMAMVAMMTVVTMVATPPMLTSQ